MTDDPSDAKTARSTALQLLARRDYCTAELRSKLCDKGFDEATSAAVVAALQHEKLLDDARYVEHFVAYHAGRGQGPIRIGRDLRALKIDGELIDRFVTGQDWLAQARRVRQKKFGAGPPRTFAEKAKQARFLQYRGFTGGQIRSALGSDVDIDDDVHGP